MFDDFYIQSDEFAWKYEEELTYYETEAREVRQENIQKEV